jgi:AraC-like DNA-binding protein
MPENSFYIPNIVFLSGTRKEYSRDEFVMEHVLAHVVAGQLQYTEATAVTVANPGDTILFRRDLLYKCEKRPTEEGPFRIVFVVLERAFLQDLALRRGLTPGAKGGIYEPVVFLQPKPPLRGMLDSLYPYITAGANLSETMMRHKLDEAVLALIEQDEGLMDWLYDFGQQGKLDLREYMQRNYMFNVPMKKFAELTGRSLSTFQRDFRKIFGMNATHWLLKRRLQAAYERITVENKKPVNIYLDLGFEDIAHFSRSFKSEFGVNASKLLKLVRGQA